MNARAKIRERIVRVSRPSENRIALEHEGLELTFGIVNGNVLCVSRMAEPGCKHTMPRWKFLELRKIAATELRRLCDARTK